MKKNLVALLCLGMLSGFANAQAPVSSAASEQSSNEKTISHRVSLGETMLMISKKYRVLPSDIYEFNPDATEGLSTGMLLKIPVDRAVAAETEKREDKPRYSKPTKNSLAEQSTTTTTLKKSVAPAKQAMQTQEVATVAAPEPVVLPNDGVFEVTHNVTTGETLSGLARKYNTSVKAITDANGSKLRNGLQIGQTITIPAGPTPETLEGVVMHNVEKGETLYGLSVKYNTTVEAITAYNESKLKHGLQTGQTLSIMPGTVQPVQEVEVEEIVVQEVKVEPVIAKPAEDTTPRTITHKLKEGDTIEGLAMQYHTTVDAIRKQNKKQLKKGLQSGQEITIPAYSNP